MAQKVFQAVWQERKDAVLLACKMIEECAVQQQERSSAIQDGLQAKADKLQKRLERLRDTYADGDITREEFLNDKQRYTEQLEKLKQQIQDLEASGKDDISGIDIKHIEETLNNGSTFRLLCFRKRLSTSLSCRWLWWTMTPPTGL